MNGTPRDFTMQVRGREWSIRFRLRVPRLKEAKRQINAGVCNHEKARITIRGDLPATFMHSVLLHELRHAFSPHEAENRVEAFELVALEGRMRLNKARRRA